MYPFKEKNGIINYLSCRRKANDFEIVEHENLYRQLKLKEL